jgi:DNA repair exonuclease SbcCD ATPase subunit
MRCLAILVLPFALAAQSGDSGKVTEALISEIQQLRLAIERSTLLNARTQLAISQFQLQETTIARLTTQLNEVRTQAPGLSGHRTRLTGAIEQSEQQRTAPEYASGPKREQLEGQIREFKSELEQANAMEVSRSAREGELASALQAAQSQIAASRARIDEMERALDAAIQQLLKK